MRAWALRPTPSPLRLAPAQLAGDALDFWAFSVPGEITFYAWEDRSSPELSRLRSITGPGNFGDRFGVWDRALDQNAVAGPAPAQAEGFCSRCLWVTAPASEPGEESVVYVIDFARAPDLDPLPVDPDADWVRVIRGIPNGHLGLAVAMEDANGDGHPDVLLGIPGGDRDDLSADSALSDASGVAHLIPGPLQSGELVDLSKRIYSGEQDDEQFGGDVEFAEIDYDGLLDVIITSRNHRKNGVGVVRGAAFFFLSAPPTIDAVTTVGDVTTIAGSHLDADVLVDGEPGVVLSFTPNELRVSPAARESVEIRGVFGSATFQLPPETRTLALGSGFNLVGWTGNTAVAEALAGIDGNVGGVFVWDPRAERFLSFNPNVPAIINDLEELGLGDGLWINIDDPDGATWTQPAFAGARSVDLVPGLQLAIWTGPDDTPIDEAIAGIAEAVAQMLTWDVAAQRFRTFNPQLPAGLNTLAALNHGEAFWIEVARAVTWDQPPRGA